MSTAVLLSGGLDSAVLVADEAASGEVQPIYVSVGLAWESAERAVVSSFLAAANLNGRVRPLVSLGVDMRDVYAATHWAMAGTPPAYHTPDEDVYLPGRNVVLLGKAAVYCAAAKIDRLAIGTLAHNPFPDATPAFREAMARALSLGLDRPLQIDAPYANTEKSEVIRRGAALGIPFELTLSCMNPPAALSPQPSRLRSRTGQASSGEARQSAEGAAAAALHCGECSKCRERHDAFVASGIPDPTSYASTANLR
jgi:7-cyano-7-deazaguanine synthase